MRKKSKPAKYEKALGVIKKLKTIFKPMQHRGTGLAAPQIGIRLRIIYVKSGGNDFSMINPEIIHDGGLSWFKEACFSLPQTLEKNGSINICRAKRIKVKFTDSDNKERIMKFDGLVAKTIQHEIDHLDGILITDI